MGGKVVKNPPATVGNARDLNLILELGRSPGVGNSNSLQYCCLENPMDGAAKQWDMTECSDMHAGVSTHTHRFFKNQIIKKV